MLAKNRAVAITPEVRKTLEMFYGKDQAATVQHAEAFEVCEYGTQPTKEQLMAMFTMARKKQAFCKIVKGLFYHNPF